MATNWWFAADVLGAISWIGLVVTCVGFIATLWALHIALVQGKAAMTAAQAANSAVTKLKNSISAVKVAYSSAQLETLSHLCSSSEHMAASVLFASLKRSLLLQADQQSTPEKELEAFRRLLQTVEHQLVLAIQSSEKFKPESLVKAVNAVKDLTVTWELEVEQAVGESINETQ
ncbi:hypothetical protein [Devosia sp.]|uniref:hypothetical protein n=1 Tax=Devosia sp. TaxID=1871048 RepID=UPI001AC541D7|nr:hypothetical protein [Devosia sp.]MBN9336129.1 hypothetical protein [Devosia sp.]